MKKLVKVVHKCDEDEFTKEVNELLLRGYEIKNTSCGFVDSSEYDFCPVYQAILYIEFEESEGKWNEK